MSIAAGCFYTVVLNHDGKLFSSGYNTQGVLAQGTRRHERRFLSISATGEFRKVSGGLYHWLAVDDDGRLWGCGNNYYGQLGISASETLRLRALKGFGGERVVSIACGLGHSLVCTALGLAFASGRNSEGQLGVGDFTNRSEFTPVYKQASCRLSLAPGSIAAGGWHSACVDSEGCVRTWGSAIGTEPGNGVPPWYRTQMPIPCKFDAQVFGGDKVLMLAAGHCHVVAVTPGAVFSWGDGYAGCLGHGDWQDVSLPKRIASFPPYKNVGDGRVTTVACGPFHNIAIHSCGTAFAWGENRRGQLGLGDLKSRCLPTRVSAALVDNNRLQEACAGTEHCAAITEGGLLYTWGRCETNGSDRFPCGLGIVNRQRIAAQPRRVTALFDKCHQKNTACLGRWHGIGEDNALAWLMGTLPRRKQRPASGCRRSRRITRLRMCWVEALPKDIVQFILDNCRGADGWF